MIKFGPSGNSEAFYNAGFDKSEQTPKWVKDLGLNAFEYSFGRGVSMGDEKAILLSSVFKNHGVEISVHAPYYVNLSNPEEENVLKSFTYLTDSAIKCRLLGGKRVIFHPASQGKMKREASFQLCLERLERFKGVMEEAGLDDMIFCPETMGKHAQIGTIEEVTEMCKISENFIPCIDFGHVNARELGSLKTEEDYLVRLKYMIDNLGYEKMRNFHMHFSKIEYSAKGEVKHLTFKDERYGPCFTPLAKALLRLKLFPVCICESSGTQDVDALEMKSIYESESTSF